MRPFRNPPWSSDVVAGVLGAFLSLPLLGADFWFDQAVFATAADTLLDGGLLYRDAWEFKPPGIFLTYALAFLTFGRDIWAVRVLEVAAVGAASWGLARALRLRLASKTLALFSACLLPLLYLRFAPNSAEPESFQLPCLAWSLALSSGPTDGSRGRIFKPAAAGLLAGGALFFKQTAVLFIPYLLIEQFLRHRDEPEGWSRLVPFLAAAAGTLLPLTTAAAYYALRGSGPEFWDAHVSFPLHYGAYDASRPLAEQLSRTARWLAWLPTLPTTLLIAVGSALAWPLHRPDVMRWAGLLLSAWAMVAIQAKYFSYHHMPLCLALAWGAGLALRSGFQWPSGGVLQGTKRILVLGLAVASAAFESRENVVAWRNFRGLASVSRPPLSKSPWPEARQLGMLVRLGTASHDTILVWGEDPLIYFFADRRPAGPYSHIRPVVEQWRREGRVSGFLDLLRRAPPAKVILCPRPIWWAGENTAENLLEEVEDLRAFIDSAYAEESVHQGYKILRRISGP